MEINGLKAIIKSASTLHGIEAPPERKNFDSDAAYESAYNDWWVRTHCWRSTTK